MVGGARFVSFYPALVPYKLTLCSCPARDRISSRRPRYIFPFSVCLQIAPESAYTHLFGSCLFSTCQPETKLPSPFGSKSSKSTASSPMVRRRPTPRTSSLLVPVSSLLKPTDAMCLEGMLLPFLSSHFVTKNDRLTAVMNAGSVQVDLERATLDHMRGSSIGSLFKPDR